MAGHERSPEHQLLGDATTVERPTAHRNLWHNGTHDAERKDFKVNDAKTPSAIFKEQISAREEQLTEVDKLYRELDKVRQRERDLLELLDVETLRLVEEFGWKPTELKQLGITVPKAKRKRQKRTDDAAPSAEVHQLA